MKRHETAQHQIQQLQCSGYEQSESVCVCARLASQGLRFIHVKQVVTSHLGSEPAVCQEQREALADSPRHQYKQYNLNVISLP